MTIASTTAPAQAQDWPSDQLESVDACPVCAGRRRALMYGRMRDRRFPTPGLWTLWRCAGCRSAYLDPRPDEASIGRAYTTYVTHAPPADEGAVSPGPLGALRRRLLRGYLNSAYGYEFEDAIDAGRRLVPLIPTLSGRADRWIRAMEHTGGRARLLDVGCANGAFMLQMQGMGWEVRGIDFDETALAYARQAGLNAARGTIADLDPASASFDAITLGHVIEHLHDPRAQLVRLRELLRPGGMLWMATPNIEALGHRLYGRDWFGLDPPRHLVLFSHAALEWLLADVGFARVDRRQPGPDAHLLFRPSEAIARGLNPVQEQPPLPPASRAKALAAELVSRRRPEAAEELLVAAWTSG